VQGAPTPAFLWPINYDEPDAPLQARKSSGELILADPTFHRRYLDLIAHIEREFPVASWLSGDVEIWPQARMDLYLDMYWAQAGHQLPKPRPRALRALSAAVTPLRNLWRSRGDLHHWIAFPKKADAIFLGDGVSLDMVDGAWQDRYCEPVISVLERQGSRTFLMQSGELARLPWRRPTFAANLIALYGAAARFRSVKPAELPSHERVLSYLLLNGVHAPSLTRQTLEKRASAVSASAAAFQKILQRVKPRLAFVVTYYAGLGPAFVLACRREGVLSVDLQHCPQEGAHKAYGWSNLPKNGYSTLPAVFWSWTVQDAADIARWTMTLGSPWHRSLHGGHTQLAPYLDGSDPATLAADARFEALISGTSFEREILVALQPVGAFREGWDALAAQIESAPANWRWWIRRHPASSPQQDVEFSRLFSLRARNVKVEECSSLPLPALLRHMSAVVSRFSGASAEAAFFGVPAFFLSSEARGQYSALIDRGSARIVEIERLIEAIDALPAKAVVPESASQPEIGPTLVRLRAIAEDYSRLVAAHPDPG
jgi:hypothetical protein